MPLVKTETSPTGHELLTLSEEGGATKVSIAPGRGGEIYSLRRLWRGEWIELIDRAGRFTPPRPGWRGGAPWLFPAVGRNLVEGRAAWRFEGVERPMPLHGFALARAWEGTARPGSIVCRSVSDIDTRRFLPFDYELQAEYFLAPEGMRAEVTVTAGPWNRCSMPFSLGNHLTFPLPLRPGGDAGACVVRTPALRNELLDARSLLAGKAVPVNFHNGVALRDEPCFSDCVLGDYPAGEVWAEVSDPASFGVRISQRELVAPGATPRTSPEHFRFVFYGDAERTFLCPEPWYGAPDSLNQSRGVVRLEPGGRFRWEMTLGFLQ